MPTAKRTTRRPSGSAVYRAIADRTRRAILDRLLQGPLTVREIARHFPISRPAVSRHLRLLRRAKLVEAEPRGRERFYHAAPAPLAVVDEWLARYRLFWQTRLLALKDFVESHPGGPPDGGS